MSVTAIIGGSGFVGFDGLTEVEEIVQETPYGIHSAPVLRGKLNGKTCLFLPRHGNHHYLPPHKVNYRANLWVLKCLGVSRIIGFNAVGGISPSMAPDKLVIPNQIIDYTFGREQTFFDGNPLPDNSNVHSVSHIDFTHPYSSDLRQKMIAFFERSGIQVIPSGVYGCVQGPRLETAAEIVKMKKDGCDIVGMTTMPEAALARELDIDYAAIAFVVNWAAGISQDVLSMVAITNRIKQNVQRLQDFLPLLLDDI